MHLTSTNPWLQPLHQLLHDFGLWLPKLLTAFGLLILGLFLAWIIRNFLSKIFIRLNFEKALHDIWFVRFWSRLFQEKKPTETMASFFFYLILFIFILLTLRVLGVGGGQILTSLLGIIPRVLSFILILFLGFLLAMFFSVLSQLALASAGSQHPYFWGKIIAWVTFGVTVIFALEPLGLVGRFLTIAVFMILGVIGIAVALAFGLGCKDLAREFIIELLKNNSSDRS